MVDVPTAMLRGAVRPLELSFGTRLPVLGVSGNDVQVATPDGRVGELPRSAVEISRPGAANPVPTGEELVAIARLFLGCATCGAVRPRSASTAPDW